jgi:hypothetical protein
MTHALSFLIFMAFSGSMSALIEQDTVQKTTDRQPIWEAYRDATTHSDDPRFLVNLEQVISEYSAKHPTNGEAIGFAATAQLMKVEGMTNLIAKFDSFLKWKSELERAIALKPSDADLRLFRLSVQLNVPGLLGYSNEIEEDTAFISQALNESFWVSDPAHEAFIRAIFTEFELEQTPAKNEH